MSKHSLFDALKNNPMFVKLDDYSYQIIENYLIFKSLETGEILFKEGDRGDFMAIVVAGRLDILKKVKTLCDEPRRQPSRATYIAPTTAASLLDTKKHLDSEAHLDAKAHLDAEARLDTQKHEQTQKEPVSEINNTVKINKRKGGNRSECLEMTDYTENDTLTREAPFANITRLSIIYKGDSIGEMSIIDELPRSATVMALEKTGLIILSKKDFDRILENYPRIGILLLKGITTKLSIHLRRTSEKLSQERG